VPSKEVDFEAPQQMAALGTFGSRYCAVKLGAAALAATPGTALAADAYGPCARLLSQM
jgi:hypothetical protein